MKKNIFTFSILILILTITSQISAQGVWTKKASFPGAGRYYDAGFSIGSYGFIGCGVNISTSVSYADFYKWSQSTNTWTPIADYPGTGYSNPVTASIEGYAYVGLGINSQTFATPQELWKYDTLYNTWAKMADFPGQGRFNVAFFTIGYKLYVIGGSTGGPPYLNDAWVYNAHTNTWKQLNNSPALYTCSMFSFSTGANGYIGGGWNNSSVQSACWKYDTTSDTWSSIAALPIPMRDNPRAFVIGGKAYICNGTSNNYPHPISAGYVYDTLTKAWSEFTNMGANGIERQNAIAFSMGNFGYIGTGEDSLGNGRTDFWQYGVVNCINGSPVVTSSRDSICDGTGVTSQLSAVGGSGSFQWQHSSDGIHFSAIAGANSASYTTPQSLSQTTFYRVVTGNNSCDTSNSVTVMIISPPVAKFNYMVNGSDVNFMADSVSSNVTGYSWDFGDNQHSNEINPIHAFGSDTTYYVCLTVSNGSNCSYTYCNYVSLSTGIKNISGDSFIQLYPDPTNSVIHFSSGESLGKYEIVIYNLFGQSVYSNSFNDKNVNIDVSEFAEGFYFLQIKNADELATKRFMVRH